MPKPQSNDADTRSTRQPGQTSSKTTGKATNTNQKVEVAKPISKQEVIKPKTNKEKFFTYETMEEEQRFIHSYDDARYAQYYMLWIKEIPKLEERIQVLEWFHDIYNPSEINLEDIVIEDEE